MEASKGQKQQLKRGNIMEIMTMKAIEVFYKNHGQQAERVFRFTVTGVLAKADNVAHSAGGDCGDIQVKSARATVCKGTDIRAYLATDGASRYAYVVQDFSVAYIMNRDIYIDFVQTFGTITQESAKNGGAKKIRLKSESRAMIEWFKERA